MEGLPLFCIRDVTETKGLSMPQPTIDIDECSGCGICVDTCPNGVLDIVGSVASVVMDAASAWKSARLAPSRLTKTKRRP